MCENLFLCALDLGQKIVHFVRGYVKLLGEVSGPERKGGHELNALDLVGSRNSFIVETYEGYDTAHDQSYRDTHRVRLNLEPAEPFRTTSHLLLQSIFKDLMQPMTSSPTHEPSDLTITESLIPSRPLASPTTISLSFSGLLDPRLLLHVDPSECGGQLWPAGMVLAKYLLRCKLPDLRGKTMFVCSACFFHVRGALEVWVGC